MADGDAPGTPLRLTALAPGRVGVVVAIDERDLARLAGHGLFPGVRLDVERDAPFGGPRIVRVGGARLAIGREIAGRIVVDVP